MPAYFSFRNFRLFWTHSIPNVPADLTKNPGPLTVNPISLCSHWFRPVTNSDGHLISKERITDKPTIFLIRILKAA